MKRGKSRGSSFVLHVFVRERTVQRKCSGSHQFIPIWLTISGLLGNVDRARRNVDGDVRAISLKELKAVFDRTKQAGVAILIEI